MSAPRPYRSCRGDWFLRVLGSVVTAIVMAFLVAVAWRAIG